MAAQDTHAACASIPRRAERPRDAPGGARRLRARRRRGSGATPRSACGWSASSPSCAIRSPPSTAATRASRPSGTRCSTRSPRRGRRARPSCALLDHEREITPDWLQREQALGYVAYADRFAGTLAGVRERLPYLRELGVSYLHLMPLLHARPEPNDGGYAVVDYGAVDPRSARWRTCARSPPRCARRAWRCASTSCSTTPRASTPGRAPRCAGDADKLAYYRTFPDRAVPDAYERTLPDVFPRHRARQLHLGAGAGALGVDDVQRLPVGPRLHEPGGVPRDGGGDARPGQRRRRRAAAGRRAVPVEARGHELAEPAGGPPAAAGVPRAAMRIAAPGRGVQGRGDRLPARPRRLPRRRPPRGQGVRPRLPQRAHGAAVERARVGPRGADHAHARRTCRRCRRAPAG